jgi:DNA modification methylase
MTQGLREKQTTISGEDPSELAKIVEYAMRLEKKSPPSVYHVNFRAVYEDNYPAKMDPELVRYLIEQYTDKDDLILDPMAGSGTIPLMALELSREAIYMDINQAACNLFLEKLQKYDIDDKTISFQAGDAADQIKAVDNSVDLILTSPPFGLNITEVAEKYSDHPDDIGNSSSYNVWRHKMKQIMANCFKALKPGKLLIIETRPRSKNNVSYPLNAWITVDGIDEGFEFFYEMIEVVMPYKMWTQGEESQRKPFPYHSYLTFLRKPTITSILDY